MARPRLSPSPEELRRYKELGLTYQGIIDDWHGRTGYRMSRGTLANAMFRAGLTTKTERYRDTLPWTVLDKHTDNLPARMLRLLGRRRRGMAIKPEDESRLDGFLRRLAEDNAVVFYTKASGFLRVDRSTVPPEYLHPEIPIITEKAHSAAERERYAERLQKTIDELKTELASLEEARERRAG